MLGQLDTQQLILLAILVSAFALLITERIRVDLTAVLIILALTISGILEPEEALSGLSSEPAVVAAAIFVLSGALFYTGLSDRFGLWIGRLAGSSYNRMMVVIMLAVALLSAFTHHGNLLIYGPGRYQFSDFLRVGTPLTLVVAVVVAWLAMLLWGG